MRNLYHGKKEWDVKMKRQALVTNPKELRELADSLEKECKESNISNYLLKNLTSIKFVVAIINRTPKCSDTWRFQK